MGFFSFMSSSTQQDMNQQMLAQLRAQLASATCPTAKQQLTEQIAKLQAQTALSQQPSPAPAPIMPPNKLQDIANVEQEFNTLRASLFRLESLLKKLKEPQ